MYQNHILLAPMAVFIYKFHCIQFMTIDLKSAIGLMIYIGTKWAGVNAANLSAWLQLVPCCKDGHWKLFLSSLSCVTVLCPLQQLSMSVPCGIK